MVEERTKATSAEGSVPDEPGIGRTRAQRWSQAAARDGTAARLEAMLQAETRVLRDELTELRDMVKSGENAPAPRRDAANPRTRSLGRGLDALLAEGDRWWDEGSAASTSELSGKDDPDA
jgi:hypothetical protein